MREANVDAVDVVYEGRRVAGETVVTRRETNPAGDGDAALVSPALPLPWRVDLRNHSPSGFEWGYGGSGPAQLALALLADALSDEKAALDLYQRFKWKVVCGLPEEGWTLTREEVCAVAEVLNNSEKTGV